MTKPKEISIQTFYSTNTPKKGILAFEGSSDGEHVLGKNAKGETFFYEKLGDKVFLTIEEATADLFAQMDDMVKKADAYLVAADKKRKLAEDLTASVLKLDEQVQAGTLVREFDGKASRKEGPKPDAWPLKGAGEGKATGFSRLFAALINGSDRS